MLEICPHCHSRQIRAYGLGSENHNLPAFVVLITPGKVDQPLYSRLWGSGFLPSRYQGVQFRSGKEPVLYLGNPAGISPARAVRASSWPAACSQPRMAGPNSRCQRSATKTSCALQKRTRSKARAIILSRWLR